MLGPNLQPTTYTTAAPDHVFVALTAAAAASSGCAETLPQLVAAAAAV
jgi:hypothetical protein